MDADQKGRLSVEPRSVPAEDERVERVGWTPLLTLRQRVTD